MKTLPKVVTEMSNLWEFSVTQSELKNLPDNWVNIKSLRNLLLSSNKIESIPESFLNLKIDRLNLHGNPIKEFPMEIINIPKFDITPKGLTYHQKIQFKKICYKTRNTDIPHESRVKGLKVWMGKLKIDRLSFKELVHISNLKIDNAVTDYLTKSSPWAYKNRPIKKGDVVLVVDKMNMKRNQIRQVLKDAGVKYLPNLKSIKKDQKVTHVLFNTSIPTACEDWEEGTCTFMSESQFMDWYHEVEQPYLVQDDEQTKAYREQIRVLINSSEDTNHELALEIIEGGGVPKTMVTDLFALAKLSPSAKVRRKAIKNLKKIASTDLLTALKESANFRNFPHFFNSYIRFFEKTEIDTVSFGITFYHLYNNYSAWHILVNGASNVVIDFARQSLIKRNKEGKKCLHLNLTFNKVPDFIYELTELEELTLYIRPTGKVNANKLLPKELAKLSKLTFLRIHMSYVHFTEVPEVLLGMTHLRNLILPYNDANIRKTLKAALKNCSVRKR